MVAHAGAAITVELMTGPLQPKPSLQTGSAEGVHTPFEQQPPLVETDPSLLGQLSPLGAAQLGDVVLFSDGRSLTVRAVVVLPSPVASMAGFVILGECEMLISAPSRGSAPHVAYLPVAHLPAAARSARVAYEGVLSYWAPHLPAFAQAMGELPFRVLDVAGSAEPWVIVYRGPELVVFVPSGELDTEQLRVLRMPRRMGEDPVQVVRHAAVVEPLHTPMPQPAPVGSPVHSPVEQPVPVR